MYLPLAPPLSLGGGGGEKLHKQTDKEGYFLYVDVNVQNHGFVRPVSDRFLISSGWVPDTKHVFLL